MGAKSFTGVNLRSKSLHSLELKFKANRKRYLKITDIYRKSASSIY